MSDVFASPLLNGFLLLALSFLASFTALESAAALLDDRGLAARLFGAASAASLLLVAAAVGLGRMPLPIAVGVVRLLVVAGLLLGAVPAGFRVIRWFLRFMMKLPGPYGLH